MKANDHPPQFPAPWACDWGEHRDYGLFMVVEINGVRQCFRWLPQGVFMMGSPESEPERWHEMEIQHPVTLRLGFWLADTACTQALWLAVMGENPSRFKDDLNNPVENVSWDDCQKFISRLNELIPDLAARLPTEAEWEYACRAGTTTPFSFGDNITLEQVNYNGVFPYNYGKKGEYRQKTVPVKSLPANPWGFYEMHGNVLEWCADWFGDYPTTAVENPTGPTAGTARVVRGGSWLISGRDVRSAFRFRITPDDRNFRLGFRLALGHSGAASQADGRRAVAGQTAAR
ncbi:MAG: formylglycine-generating enzyme family protein [Methylococcaceae bacterium]|nr:formylglycine-generating enzyme family protein [Methylococcaceae bacterium]